LFTAVSYANVMFTTTVLMSEQSYLLFSALGLLLLHRYADQKSLLSPLLFLATGAVAFSYYVRTVGIALVVAAPLYFMLRKDWKRALVICSLLGLFLLPWWLRNASIGTSGLAQDYTSILLLKDWVHPEWGTVSGPGEIALRVLRNIGWHLTEPFQWLFFPTLVGTRLVPRLEQVGLGWLPGLINLLFVSLILLGFASSLRRGVSFLGLYLPLYVGIILLPPWHIFLKLLPVLPFLLYYFVVGLRLVLDGLRARMGLSESRAHILVGMVLLGLLTSNLVSDRHTFARGAEFRREGVFYEPNMRGLTEVAAWLQHQTSEDDLVFFAAPEMMYLASGRQTASAFVGNTSIPIGFRNTDNVQQEIRRHVDYVVVYTESQLTPQLDQVILADPSSFQPVYRTSSEPAYLVLAVRGGAE
jgi:hypothetical protein